MRQWLLALILLWIVGAPAWAALPPISNFAFTTLSTGYDSVATSIVVTTGGGAKFPASFFPYNVVWWNCTDFGGPHQDANAEFVAVTNRVGDTFTITRAQEGTSAVNHNTGGKTYCLAQVFSKAYWDALAAELGAVSGSINDVVDASAYASFNAAVAAIGGSAIKTLRVSNNQPISSNVTVTANITVWCIGSGKLSVATGVTVTFSSPDQLRCEKRRQIFSLTGTGIVSFSGPGTVYPYWWGAVADATTDDGPEIQQAHDSLPAAGGKLDFFGGTFKSNNEVLISKSDVIVQLGPSTLNIANIAGSGTSNIHDTDAVLAGFKVTGSNVRIVGGRITGSPTVGGKQVVGVLAHNSVNTKVGGTKIDGLFGCVWVGGNALFPHLQNMECSGDNWGVLLGYWPTSATSPQVTGAVLMNVKSHDATVGSGVRCYSYAYGTRIIGGDFYSNVQHGIDGYPGCEGLLMTDANVYSNTKSGLYGAYGALTGTIANKLGIARRWSIGHNRFVGNTEHNVAIFLPDYSLFSTVGGVEDITLTDNISSGSGQACYRLGLKAGTVRGNIARECTHDGFQLLTSSDTTISANQSWDHGSGGDNRRAFIFMNSPTTGGTPPNSTRITFADNMGGDTRAGGSRTVNFAIDLAEIDTSQVHDNIGYNANTNDWINANGLTAMAFWNNQGSCSSCQIGARVAKHLSGSKTWDPPSLNDFDITSTTVTVTGTAVGDRAICNLTTLTTVQQLTAIVNATDTVTAVLRNISGGVVDTASGTLTCEVLK